MCAAPALTSESAPSYNFFAGARGVYLSASMEVILQGRKNVRKNLYLLRNALAFGGRKQGGPSGHINRFGPPVGPEYLKPVNFDCAAQPEMKSRVVLRGVARAAHNIFALAHLACSHKGARACRVARTLLRNVARQAQLKPMARRLRHVPHQ